MQSAKLITPQQDFQLAASVLATRPAPVVGIQARRQFADVHADRGSLREGTSAPFAMTAE
jgi:hypothetical protein